MQQITRKKLKMGLLLNLLLPALVACGNATSTNVISTATLPLSSTITSIPTPTQPPLYLSVTLGSIPKKDQGKSPSYTIEVELPTLQNNDDPRVTKFNNEVILLVQQEISVFKDNVRELAPVPISNGSTLSGKFSLLSAPGNILSLKFEFIKYIAGSAHTGTHSRTLTYDLEAGSDVSLDQLFRSGSNYIQVISDYCLAQLTPRIPGLFTNGLDRTSSNYQSWNIGLNGLLINFDENQVAPYALGPQQVVIPYSALKEIIDPHGPLAAYLP